MILKIYRNLLLILLTISFSGCDKKGNPLPSSYNFKCEINGIKYKDQGPMFLIPGAQRSPRISVEEKYILLSTLVKSENGAEQENSYSIILNIPNRTGILLNQAIPFKPAVQI